MLDVLTRLSVGRAVLVRLAHRLTIARDAIDDAMNRELFTHMARTEAAGWEWPAE